MGPIGEHKGGGGGGGVCVSRCFWADPARALDFITDEQGHKPTDASTGTLPINLPYYFSHGNALLYAFIRVSRKLQFDHSVLGSFSL